jgi:hypothetical protein
MSTLCNLTQPNPTHAFLDILKDVKLAVITLIRPHEHALFTLADILDCLRTPWSGSSGLRLTYEF